MSEAADNVHFFLHGLLQQRLLLRNSFIVSPILRLLQESCPYTVIAVCPNMGSVGKALIASKRNMP
jgi:hypothetical protein